MNYDNMFTDYPDILNTKYLQAMLGLSNNSVLDLLKDGKFKYFRNGTEPPPAKAGGFKLRLKPPKDR